MEGSSYTWIDEILGLSGRESFHIDPAWDFSDGGHFSVTPQNDTATLADDLDTELPHPKVPIPRDSKPRNWTRGRVSRACENCHEQKAKCSGQRPTCDRCQQANVQCSYGDRKRERMLKQVADLTSRAEAYEKVLRAIHPRLDTPSAQLVERTLNELSSNAQKTQISPRLTYGAIFPIGAMDHTNEDLNNDSRLQSMGLTGQLSEMASFHRLGCRLVQDPSRAPVAHDELPSITSMNYFLDDADLPVFDKVDLMHWPPRLIADRLVHRFFNAIHPLFPVIGRMGFLEQYTRFYSIWNARPRRRWRTVLNLIFAVAQIDESLEQNQSLTDSDGHLVYFSRAWQLNGASSQSLEHPDLQQVQIEGLLAFYMFSTGHLNRSWRLIGIAIRSALAMGIHLRSDTRNVTPLSKETRYRLWWALVMLETVLCVMTGRPPSTSANFCTTPLPVPFGEEDIGDQRVAQFFKDRKARSIAEMLHLSNDLTPSQDDDARPPQLESQKKEEMKLRRKSNSLNADHPLYLLHAVNLTLIMRETIATLYAPASVQRSWRGIEIALTLLNNNADKWHSHLPSELQFNDIRTDGPFTRQRTHLAFHFFSLKLVICQPCLGPLKMPSEASSLGNLCESMAAICVRMGILMIDVLPDSPELKYMESLPPWSYVLHYLMQSVSVLLMRLLARNRVEDEETAGIVKSLEKAIRWLKFTSARHPPSKRAWSICVDLLDSHGPKIDLDKDKDESS
ncbi:hypothetical protein N7476_000571 [Penicillium atrosanguineum]|uniref:Zn(2)-C6 fungal-type domain-containing protein n=1 Tax=Penicillium atrosanguineum TaxID=1132637 RepID=A0A9W9QEP8_9EURO|nr:hypothetical protein N7526_001268 [Penicillium atrosanguineum]KAJ5330788.1 hypothetical protein N7476_000571 [Penicillium atrosanguineum]